MWQTKWWNKLKYPILRQGKTSIRWACLALCFIFAACGVKEGDKGKFHSNEEEQSLRDNSKRAEFLADSLLTTLTLEQIVGQCLMPSLPSNTDSANLERYRRYIDDYHVGGVVLLIGNVEAALKLSEIGELAKVPLFIAIDAEWGLGMRLKDASVYPKNGDINPEAEETELYDYGSRVALESRDLGINMVLGPVVDISSGNSGVIGKRSFGSDPRLVSNFAIAYSKGLEAGGVVSVAKHFPGHGSTVMDSHKGVAKINRDLSSLDSLDLKPFRDYIDAGLTGVMAGHIQSKALDPDGNAATVSMDMLSSLLREEMGFKGLVLTDAFDMGGAEGVEASRALRAGADLILCPLDIEKEYKNILEEVEKGTLDLKTVKDRCRRILFIKYLFGII